MPTELDTSFMTGSVMEADHLKQFASPIQQLESGAAWFRPDVGTAANDYEVEFDDSDANGLDETDLAVGQLIRFKANYTNTGPSTLTVHGLTGASSAIPLTKFGGQELRPGDIQADQMISVIYNDEGTYGRFEVLGFLGASTANGSLFLGDLAGEYVSGAYNLGVGDNGLHGKSTGLTGDYNVGICDGSGSRLSTGAGNFFAGYNMGIGASAGFTGSHNAGVGSASLQTATSASYNVLLGYGNSNGSSCSGSYNVSQGYGANHNGNGSYHVLLGLNSGYAVTTGTHNIALGHNALYRLTTGSGNVAMGYSSAYDLTSSQDYGVHLGRWSGRYVTSSSRLAIHSSVSASNPALPLVEGEFDNRILAFNGWQRLPDRTSHPTVASGETYTYRKGTYFVVVHNDSGTVKYSYVDLTSGTWSYSTTAP